MCVYICNLRSFQGCLISAHHEGPHDIIFSILFITCSAVDIFPEPPQLVFYLYCDTPSFSFHAQQQEKLFPPTF